MNLERADVMNFVSIGYDLLQVQDQRLLSPWLLQGLTSLNLHQALLDLCYIKNVLDLCDQLLRLLYGDTILRLSLVFHVGIMLLLLPLCREFQVLSDLLGRLLHLIDLHLILCLLGQRVLDHKVHLLHAHYVLELLVNVIPTLEHGGGLDLVADLLLLHQEGGMLQETLLLTVMLL